LHFCRFSSISSLKVVLGAHNISSVGETSAIRMPVAKVINHESFDIAGEKAFDISLIKLYVGFIFAQKLKNDLFNHKFEIEMIETCEFHHKHIASLQ
jgi:hypothetical protein